VITRLVALVVMLATAAAATASSTVRDEPLAPARIVGASSLGTLAVSARPKPLRGVPLRGSTGLRLLVANSPPFILNVDTGRITRISGLKIGDNVVLTVFAVGRHAIVWLDRNRPRTTFPRAEIYVVRRGATRATRLATAWEVASAADGSAVWLKRYDDARHCTLREVLLDGTERQSPRPVACSARLVDAGAGAVLVDGTSVRDPSTRETLLVAPDLWAMVGDYAITSEGSQGPFTVSHLRSGERWPLRNPSRIADQGGADEAAVETRRQLVALSYSNPAYGLTQVTDTWLLDPTTRRLRPLPDMPAIVSIKRTSMEWTSDGRLVLLAKTEGRNVVAVWRPGQKRIRVRPVRLPVRNSGSDAFVVWRAAP
jgi:hypothetical protein